MHDFRPYRGQTVHVVMVDDSTLIGSLADVGRTTLLLAEVGFVPAAGGEPTPVDGAVLVPFERVAWVQVP